MTRAIKRLIYGLGEKYAFVKVFIVYFIILLPLSWKIIKILFSKRYVEKKYLKKKTVGFFHPNCSAFAPQENVLWSAVKAIEKQYKKVQIVIYTSDLNASSDEIFDKVESKFNIVIQSKIRFIHLRQGKWLKSFAYLGSMWVACEALSSLKPDIIIDTMGCGFVNPIFKYAGRCKVINYIHNPLVSREKLRRRQIVFSNNQYILKSRSPIALGTMKGIAVLYGWMGRAADVVMVNSAWSEENINLIWKCPQKVQRVYPPIGLEKLAKKCDCYWYGKVIFQIINASEFKPENNHELILKAISKLRLKVNESIKNEISLVLINLSTEIDEAYMQHLNDLIKELNLEDCVKVYPKCLPVNELEDELVKSSFGIYAKADDSFGSDVLAGLVSGQIVIVHNSGASKKELIDTGNESRNGYLARSVHEYVAALLEAVNLTPMERQSIQKNARQTAEQFSRMYFQKNFLKTVEPFLEINK